jgi:hypothetical protein
VVNGRLLSEDRAVNKLKLSFQTLRYTDSDVLVRIGAACAGVILRAKQVRYDACH